MVECLVSLQLSNLLIVFLSSLEPWIDRLFRSDLVYHTHDISFHTLDNFSACVRFHSTNIVSADVLHLSMKPITFKYASPSDSNHAYNYLSNIIINYSTLSIFAITAANSSVSFDGIDVSEITRN